MLKTTKKYIFDRLASANKIVKCYLKKDSFDNANDLQYAMDLQAVKRAFDEEENARIERFSHSIKTNGSYLYDYDIIKSGRLLVKNYEILVVQTDCNVIWYILEN